MIHGKNKFACPVPNKRSFREQVFGNIHNMYAYGCTRTYVRVHLALLGRRMSIKRTNPTGINKTLIILTLHTSCDFS